MMESFWVNLDLLQAFNSLKMHLYTTVTEQTCIVCYSKQLLEWEQHYISGHGWKSTLKTTTAPKLRSTGRLGGEMLSSVRMGLKVVQECLSSDMKTKR